EMFVDDDQIIVGVEGKMIGIERPLGLSRRTDQLFRERPSRQRPGSAECGRGQQRTGKKLSSSRFHTVSVPPRRQNLPDPRPICPPAENIHWMTASRDRK